MSDGKTMKLLTNLDRPAIEGKLGQLDAAAKGKGLAGPGAAPLRLQGHDQVGHRAARA
ncbi:MAG: hypothetical protein O3A06_07085 [Proteobacteria bacterium]|nr:hypothetical protein [Pseudomonadota bacterium]MDA0982781.1 hypothetical protein [Pseudomonadota bacterium]